MFSLLPLLATEIIIPKPIRITIPIKVHVAPISAKSPNFQSAARMPPTKITKPTRYIPAHFIANLHMRSSSRAGLIDRRAQLLGAAPRHVAVPRAQGHDRPAVVELRILYDLDLHDVVDGEMKFDATPRVVADDAHSCLVA